MNSDQNQPSTLNTEPKLQNNNQLQARQFDHHSTIDQDLNLNQSSLGIQSNSSQGFNRNMNQIGLNSQPVKNSENYSPKKKYESSGPINLSQFVQQDSPSPIPMSQQLNPNQANLGNQSNPNQGYNQNMNQINFSPQHSKKYSPKKKYGGQQPLIPRQAPMPNLKQDTYIVIRQYSDATCFRCGYKGQSITKQTAGNVAFLWCICLFFCVWPLFWLPFCMDTCKDTQIICSRCKCVKGVANANCF